jgi:hypothetical protein
METAPYEFNTENLVAARRTFLPKVYSWMTVALGVTTLSALLTVGSPALLSLIFSSKISFWILVGIELALVFYLSARIQSLSYGTAIVLYLLYSAVNGAMLSSIFFVFDIRSIGITFLVTTLMFGMMALYGYKTKEDLTRFGAILSMALIGLLLAMVVNFFVASSMMEWIISLAGVLIFVGLIAWDSQKLKMMSLSVSDTQTANKLSILGALTLYLDFINLFLFLLRLFGSRRN